MNARLNRRDGARGYTLLETAIVLTAFLLVAGGMIYPLSNTWNEQTYRTEAEYVKSLRGSILSYAASNRNINHRLAFEGTNIVATTVTVPGGRPHLPCPDLDGDGYEDRIRRVADDALITMTVLDHAVGGVTTYVVNQGYEPGRCIDDKGLLPYRTLGVRASDQWGNFYTYWVDSNFSNSATGFDQSTRGSQIFKYAIAPIPGLTGPASGRLGRHYQYLQHIYYDSSAATWLNAFTLSHSTFVHFFSPGVILDETGRVVAGEVLDTAAPPQTYDHRRIAGRVGSSVPVNEYFGSTRSGVPASSSSNLDYRLMANGIAFAIVSHGRNGNGATKYLVNTEGDYRFTCNDPSSNREERFNAMRTSVCYYKMSHSSHVSPPRTYDIGCTLTFPCGRARNGIFHVSSTGFDQRDAQRQVLNDDIISWMSASEMMVRLTEDHVLPLPLPPVALIEGR